MNSPQLARVKKRKKVARKPRKCCWKGGGVHGGAYLRVFALMDKISDFLVAAVNNKKAQGWMIVVGRQALVG